MTALNTNNTQSWSPASNGLWGSVPGTVDTTQKAPLGTIAQFKDPYFGVGEFIYLLGVASTVVGDPVSYIGSTYATTRAVAGAGVPLNIAFATAATVASTWGWYQIGGLAVANKTKTVSLAAGVGVGISTTALIALSSSLKELQGARVAIVASATTTTNYGGKVILVINRPHIQGRIT
jgi:hypothetical protein